MRQQIKAKLPVLREPNVGLKGQDSKVTSEQLLKILASLFYLKLKNLNITWNSSGIDFLPLVEVLNLQSLSLDKYIHKVADRILCLGFSIPISYAYFSKHSIIKENISENDFESNYISLLFDHEIMTRYCREVLDQIQEFNDDVTNVLIIELLDFHENCAQIFRRLSSKNSSTAFSYNH